MRKTSPKHHVQQQHHLRIPSILEQAIKAEPKVEVERINSPCVITPAVIEESSRNSNIVAPTQHQQQQPTSAAATAVSVRTTYPNNNSRPNLETIVEAIRHLEGDAFDMDEETSMTTSSVTVKCTQEAPLALTTSRQMQQVVSNGHVKEPFKFRQSATSQAGLPQFVSVPLQQKPQQQQQASQYHQQQVSIKSIFNFHKKCLIKLINTPTAPGRHCRKAELLIGERRK